MNEVWREVPGYQGEYEASNLGRVRNVWTGKELKQPTQSGKDYLRVNLRRKAMGVHRVVLLAFRGIPGDDEVGRHLDGDPTNNRLDNLAWGTAQENSDDMLLHGTRMRGTKHHKAKLTEEQARAIKHSTKSSRALAAEHGISRSSVQDIRKGRRWGWMN